MALEALKAYIEEQEGIEVPKIDSRGIQRPKTKEIDYIRVSPQLTETALKRLANLHMRQARYIQESEQDRHKLAKGLRTGEAPERLLLIAVECISKITGDTVLLDLYKKRLA